jgi:hypothetical protein
MGQNRTACMLLVEIPEGVKPLERPRCRWLDNIKMNLVEIIWGSVDLIGVSWDRNKWRALVNAVTNLQVHKLLGNYRVATQLVASRVALSSTKLVN